MEALNLRAEQPLDFWLTPDELKECFQGDFEITALHTASFFTSPHLAIAAELWFMALVKSLLASDMALKNRSNYERTK